MSAWKFVGALEVIFVLVIVFSASALAIQASLESDVPPCHYMQKFPVNFEQDNYSNARIALMTKCHPIDSDGIKSDILLTPSIQFDVLYPVSRSYNSTGDMPHYKQDVQEDLSNSASFTDGIEYRAIYGSVELLWQKCLGGSDFERGNSIKQTNDGDYIVAGTTGSDDGDMAGSGFHGEFDFWIAKLTSAGAIKWQKCLGGNGSETAYSIQQTNDGGYIVAGDTNSNDGDVIDGGFHGEFDYWVVKLDGSGSIQWHKCLGGSDYDSARSVQQTNDGGYIVAGMTRSNDGDVAGGGFHGGADIWIVKLSRNGAIQWQKCLGGSDDDTAESIRMTVDGGFIVTGTTYSHDGDVTGKHNPGSRNPDFWVVKLNSDGAIQWQKCLGGSDYDWGYSGQQTADGGYIFCGNTFSDDGDVIENHGASDSWVVKLNSVGVIQWQRSLGGSRTDEAYSIEQTGDGGYIIAGDTYSDDGDVNGSHVAPYYIFPDFWIAKLDDVGNIEWQKALGGMVADIAHGVGLTSDDKYIIVGFTNSNDGDVSGNHGFGDIWVVKLGSEREELSIALETANGQFVCAENGGGGVVQANCISVDGWGSFKIIDLGNGNVALQAANGQYLCAEGGGGDGIVANRDAVLGWETFKLIDLGNGNVALQAANGQYLCAEGGGGDGLVANRNWIDAWETFRVVDLRRPAKVALQAYNGQYLCAEGGGGDGVVANRKAALGWETFNLIDRGNGNIALQAYNGQYLCAEGSGGREIVANRNAIAGWETFRLIYRGNGNVALQAYNGQYVCAEGGGGNAVVANRNWISSWETFKMIPMI
ncbi:MAG: hypothetical protein IPI63_07370 [Methanothrix sp.]|jgi:hypothetical protein|uniref:fascin domain-containing protein n=1 Tax=Methanothrix sp. TaxID=90426 RepID=UPI0026001E13|nr:hypothetical protein [Methanothrix sp.]MBK7386539.1 hypothetical protein [Methanothrix sp.]